MLSYQLGHLLRDDENTLYCSNIESGQTHTLFGSNLSEKVPIKFEIFFP